MITVTRIFTATTIAITTANQTLPDYYSKNYMFIWCAHVRQYLNTYIVQSILSAIYVFNNLIHKTIV